MNLETKRFLQEYNNMLDEINDEISGVDDMTKNKKVIKLSDVNILDLEQSEFLYNWYIEINKNTKN